LGGSVVMNLKDTFFGCSMGNPDIPAEVFELGDWPVCSPCRDRGMSRWGHCRDATVSRHAHMAT
jgi:hypothetical protein